jgi:hypothetical protein
MRMWNVPVEYLCRNHALGEHLEMHMFIGCLKKGISLKGYIDKGMVEVHNIKKRHDELAKSFSTRNYNHKSPIEEFDYIETGYVNIEQNIEELKRRCKKCKERIENAGK